MNTIELFAGTKSFSKVASLLGHKTLTLDNNKHLNPDLCVDFTNFNLYDLISDNYDVCWASPPCTAFSVASIGKHWGGGYRKYIPQTETARIGLLLVDKTIEFISKIKPKIWFIENPRGVMRKIIDLKFKNHAIEDYRRVTITYCQYGDKRMKPTDIWTNCKAWKPKPMCHNGDSCHISAPRGSRTGTQGLKGAIERSRIPEKLFIEIFISLKEV